MNADNGGERHRVNFDGIGIDTPVISVKKIVRHGSHVRMLKNGSYIKNKSTGKRLPFVVRQGVYFIKLTCWTQMMKMIILKPRILPGREQPQ